MYALVRPFIEVCLLRSGPQQLPASNLLLGLALLVHTTTSALASTLLLPVMQALLAGITGTALLAGLTTALLYVQSRQARLVQTVTALTGCTALIDLVALPVTRWWQASRASGEEASFAVLLLLVLTGWNLAVVAHIFRHALSSAFFVGLIVALVMYWVFINVINTLFPAAL